MLKSKILFIMTGSIACFKACQAISKLVQNGYDIQVVATPSALEFVGNATIEGLTGKTVISDLFGPGTVMDHIHLMRWADLIIVAPATAHFINKAAHGNADDLVSTLFLAHDFKKPFLLAPAMNSSMYLHPVTQNSLKQLKQMGIEILDPNSGSLACGEVGAGRLVEPEEITRTIDERLKTPQATNDSHPSVSTPALNILITSGGTQEAIDTVRVITNLSSGKTGIKIAEAMQNLGFNITLLRAHNSADSRAVANKFTFTDFASLQKLMSQQLQEKSFDVVIHLAAVSDYSVEHIAVDGVQYQPFEVSKLSSDADKMYITLKKNKKIVNEIRDYSQNKKVKIVAFKLTSRATASEKTAAVQKLFASSHADFVVHNDLTDIDIAQNKHFFNLYTPNEIIPCSSVENLILHLAQKIAPEVMI